MRDKVCVAGHGRLAQAVQNGLLTTAYKLETYPASVENYDNLETDKTDSSRMVVIHCGSGRQLPDIIKLCNLNGVPMIQCSTGAVLPDGFLDNIRFTLVNAPNLSIPIIKILYLLEQAGELFREYDISVTESHQSTKTSPPGTAYEISRLLGVNRQEVKSVRDENTQRHVLGIPEEYLSQHALHLIEIKDEGCEITLKTEIHGLDTYLRGLVRIISNIDRLEPGVYGLRDLVRDGVI